MRIGLVTDIHEHVEWLRKGELPISLDQGRYFIVIGALCLGRCAIFDTDTSALRPFNLGAQ